MIDGHSEKLKNIKKAMKIHEIVSSDSKDFKACKNDLMTKVAMNDGDASEVASAIRDLFMPKLLKSEGIGAEDLPESFNFKMTDTDEDFSDDNHGDMETEDQDFPEFDAHADEEEVDDNEIATIHIKVPANKVRAVENALEQVLGDTDAQSEDHAMVHKDTQLGDSMDIKTEAKKALRKTILAAMAEDKEIQSVSHDSKFDYAKSEQYREEDFYDAVKGNLTDPDFSTLDFNEQDIPVFSDLVSHIGKDLGLSNSLKPVKFDGAPVDREEYTLEFNPFDIPSQGNEDLYGKIPIPSEGKLPRKRTVNSSTLGEFDADAAEEVLAAALRSAGVEDSDLKKLSYAEGLTLFKAIKTASDMKERTSYFPDGKFDAEHAANHPKDPDKHEKTAVTEDLLREHTGTKEEDPEKDHMREGKELYSNGKNSKDAYAQMLQKLMKQSMEEDDMEESQDDKEKKKEGATKVDVMPDKTQITQSSNDLYRARLKTSYAMASKLALAGMLPAGEVEAYAEGMLNDNLTVTAMLRQTNLMIDASAIQNEKYAASHAGNSVRTASSGISFNPSMKNSVDLSGAMDIQRAINSLEFTQPKVGTED